MKRIYLTMLLTACTMAFIFSLIGYVDIRMNPFFTKNGTYLFIMFIVFSVILSLCIYGYKQKTKAFVSIILIAFIALNSPKTLSEFKLAIKSISYAASCIFAISCVLAIQFQNNKGNLLYQKEQYEILKTSPDGIRCNFCGEYMHKYDIFCKQCWKITPKVKLWLSTHPNQPPLSFTPLSNGRRERCPHCQSHYLYCSRAESRWRTIESPIRFCPQCNGYFLDPVYREWSVIGPKQKLTLFFSLPATGIAIFCFAIIFSIYCRWFIGPLIILFTLIIRIIWYKFIKTDEINDSKLRLEQNSDYAQILVDMGYASEMDGKYQSLAKHKQLKIIDIIKDAVTFD